MQINGSLPFHVARAYGVSTAQPAAPSRPATPANAAPPTPPPAQVQPTDAADTTQPSAKIQSLVAGQVTQPIDFNATPAAKLAPGATLQLYNRAADRIEAATAVRIGRSLDVTG